MSDPVREFLHELTREPYADSDPASLLSWARGRAAAVLAEMDKREPADLRRVREALEPFARYAQSIKCTNGHDMSRVANCGLQYILEVRDMKRAAAALASLDAVAQRMAEMEAQAKEADGEVDDCHRDAGFERLVAAQVIDELRGKVAELGADKARLEAALVGLRGVEGARRVRLARRRTRAGERGARAHLVLAALPQAPIAVRSVH